MYKKKAGITPASGKKVAELRSSAAVADAAGQVLMLVTERSVAYSRPMHSDYRHAHRHSALAHGVKLYLRILRRKHILTKEMLTGRIPQHAAPVPASLKKRFRFTHHSFRDHGFWTVAPEKQQSTQSETTVVYMHGGAYVHNMTRYHWDLIGALAGKTGARFLVPDYPLAPTHTCDAVYEFMHAMHADVISSVAPKRMILMGDSAGGGIALGLSEEWKDATIRPQQTILISPWLDTTLSHPAVEQVNMHDFMLSADGLRLAGKAYAGALPDDHHRHSPKHARLNGVAPISLFTGTHDVLYPDIVELRDRLRRQAHPVRYFEYPQMFHVWPAVTALDEARHAIDQMAALIKEG